MSNPLNFGIAVARLLTWSYTDVLQLSRCVPDRDATPEAGQQHDLLREYARGLVEGSVENETADGLARLIDYYVLTTALANIQLFPHAPYQPQVGTPQAAHLALDSADTATEWLEAERANLIATGRFAADQGRAREAGQLADHLFRFLGTRAYHEDGMGLLVWVERAGRIADDLLVQANALSEIGVFSIDLGRPAEAYEAAERALELFRTCGDRNGEAWAARTLGQVHLERGEHDRAVERFEQFSSLGRESDDLHAVASATFALGEVHIRRGDLTLARSCLREALENYQKVGNAGGRRRPPFARV